MTIEKRGVMYWINFAILTLLVLGSIAFAILRILSVVNLLPESYELKLVLTYSILLGIASVFMIVGLVFYILKKIKLFSFMMAGFYLALLAMFMRGFDRAHRYLLGEYTIVQKMVVITAILLIVFALFNSLVLYGLFKKTVTKIITLASMIVSFVSLVYIVLWFFVWNGITPDQSVSVGEEFLYTALVVILFAVPIFINSLWVFISTIKNKILQFANMHKNVRYITPNRYV